MKLLKDNSNFNNLEVSKEFNDIIIDKLDGYDGTKKDKLKFFFEDLQQGGCITGLISEFIYTSDCKDFYIKHIDELEEMRELLNDDCDEYIKNRHQVPHYTFMCWLCFEEYCYNLYNNIFES